jgi:hypothetical protein
MAINVRYRRRQGKGEKWCKRAIWGNTLPAMKRVWKKVDNVTSDGFVGMWRQRISHFYSRYADRGLIVLDADRRRIPKVALAS